MTEGTKQWALEADAVLRWMATRDFAGYDPFDGLESTLFRRTPFANLPLARLTWIQLHKRLPINLRPLLGVAPSRNPKAVGLVLLGLARQAQARKCEVRELGDPLVAWLASARASGSAGWGYPFAWQNRAFYAPRGTPNAVCTAFVVAGLLDYSEVTGSAQAAKLADSSLPFFMEELQHSMMRVGTCFSYTPLDRTMIHNVNLLVAATVARLGVRGNDRHAIDLSTGALEFSHATQQDDGSWPYGEGAGQGWIDSFHTGFNLGALRALELLLRSDTACDMRAKGYRYYRSALLTAGRLPKYYTHSFYPVDVHVAAQAIVTVLENADIEPQALEIAEETARWTWSTLRLSPGRYAYRRTRFGIVPLVYMRWCQAWMFRALCELEWSVAGGGRFGSVAESTTNRGRHP